MQNLLSDLINSYEMRLSAVENLITDAYGTSAYSHEDLSRAEEESKRLKEELKEALAQNCSLRRKDFDRLMTGIFAQVENSRQQIKAEHGQTRERLAGYIKRQKELAASLREAMSRLIAGEPSSRLEELLGDIKSGYDGEWEQTRAQLQKFQLRVRNFRSEQEMLNRKLKKLLEKGDLLRLEDLRQLESTTLREAVGGTSSLFVEA